MVDALSLVFPMNRLISIDRQRLKQDEKSLIVQMNTNLCFMKKRPFQSGKKNQTTPSLKERSPHLRVKSKNKRVK